MVCINKKCFLVAKKQKFKGYVIPITSSVVNIQILYFLNNPQCSMCDRDCSNWVPVASTQSS